MEENFQFRLELVSGLVIQVIWRPDFEDGLRKGDFSSGSSCRQYKMVLVKIGKQLFYNFYMKFMIWLDYASSKFPILWLREGEKGRGKFTDNPNYS